MAPSLLLRHACSSWGNLAANEYPLWESCRWWASCSLQPTRTSCPMLAQQSSYWTCTLELTLLSLHQLQLSLLGDSAMCPLWRCQTTWPSITYYVDHTEIRRQPTMFTIERQFHESATMLTSELFIFLLSTCSAEHAPHSHVLDTSSYPMTWSVQIISLIL